MKHFFFILSISFYFNTNAQNTVCLTIESNPNSNQAGLGLFTKYVNVLDCFSVYAESSISDEKVLHAAAVAAELLDNDENGFVDDDALKAELQLRGALIPIFYQENSNAENLFFNEYNGEGAAAVLYNNEMNPSTPGYWGSDATVEEVIHVINAIGHTSIYPSAFSVEPNSSLMTTAMDVARGGQFLIIPNPYPSDAWYHYDDETCDYQCMAIEYMYWSIVSWMGILNDQSTCDGIANEWEPCSPSLFQSTDVLMHALITDSQYKLPQLAPNGSYCPTNSGIHEDSKGSIHLYPNPALEKITLENSFSHIIDLKITDYLGREINKQQLYPGANIINLDSYKTGVYSISYNGKCEKFIHFNQ